MAKQNKTVETKNSVTAFLKKVKDAKKREDCMALINIISKHTKLEAKMWGPAIIGFGTYHYKYESGREGDAPLVGLSPRANAIVLYLTNARAKQDLLKKLGKHKMSGGCIYIQKLEDIDPKVLILLVDNAIKYLKKLYPG